MSHNVIKIRSSNHCGRSKNDNRRSEKNGFLDFAEFRMFAINNALVDCEIIICFPTDNDLEIKGARMINELLKTNTNLVTLKLIGDDD